jgi:hypothetical protein
VPVRLMTGSRVSDLFYDKERSKEKGVDVGMT